MKRFYLQLRQRLAQQFTWARRRVLLSSPGLLVEPNPCVQRDVLTMHLRGLRCCPLEVCVHVASGELLSQRSVFPLSDNHRLPLFLPTHAPPGMYCVQARQPSGKVLNTWVAMLDKNNF